MTTKYKIDAKLPSTPATVVWGYIAPDVPPALRIRSGQTVSIDTVSHQGLLRKGPAADFGESGVQAGQVLQDAIDIFHRVKRSEGAGVHVLTGPIYVEEAQPGDMLEVRILDIAFRVPYGVNASGPGSGALPELLDKPAPKTIALDLGRGVALFSRDIEIALSPFMGIMAVAPPPEAGRASTKPPGRWGGNMDLKQLTAGATLYLPVYNDGALFYTGDGHAMQGDGEVNGTAIEISLTPTLQFIVHKNAGTHMKWPRAENAAHYCVMGMDADLNVALKHAVQEAVDFLQGHAGISAADAYALCSIGVDFRVGEAVNNIKMVYGMIPKQLFRKKTQYWHFD